MTRTSAYWGYLSESHPFSGVAWLRTCSNSLTQLGQNALSLVITFLREGLPVHHLFANVNHDT
jgi:hypothetical protein